MTYLFGVDPLEAMPTRQEMFDYAILFGIAEEDLEIKHNLNRCDHNWEAHNPDTGESLVFQYAIYDATTNTPLFVVFRDSTGHYYYYQYDGRTPVFDQMRSDEREYIAKSMRTQSSNEVRPLVNGEDPEKQALGCTGESVVNNGKGDAAEKISENPQINVDDLLSRYRSESNSKGHGNTVDSQKQVDEILSRYRSESNSKGHGNTVDSQKQVDEILSRYRSKDNVCENMDDNVVNNKNVEQRTRQTAENIQGESVGCSMSR